jgi:predicted transcriptional regulator
VLIVVAAARGNFLPFIFHQKDEKNNFDQYFFDVRINKPQKNQVLVKYSAMAELVDGVMKKNLIELCKKDKVHAATQVMRKLAGSCEIDSVRVLKEMCQDIISGMSDEEVEKKIYKYKFEMFYYTEKKYIPDDPHWSAISINNLDSFLEGKDHVISDENNADNKLIISSKIIDHATQES